MTKHETRPPRLFYDAIPDCPRCSWSHAGVLHREFYKPFAEDAGDTWEWWGLCPTTIEPILFFWKPGAV